MSATIMLRMALFLALLMILAFMAFLLATFRGFTLIFATSRCFIILLTILRSLPNFILYFRLIFSLIA